MKFKILSRMAGPFSTKLGIVGCKRDSANEGPRPILREDTHEIAKIR